MGMENRRKSRGRFRREIRKVGSREK